MSINEIVSFISLKYIQYIQIYLFFAYMIGTNYQYYFISFFILDKVIRLTFITLNVKPNCCKFIGIFFVVLFQIEEILSFFYRPQQNDDDFDDYYYPQYFLEMIYKSEAINTPMIPQMIFILIWNLIERNEVIFLLSIPCFFFLSFYVNQIWAILMNSKSINYADMIPEYISLAVQLGAFIICLNVPNFIILTFTINMIFSLFMTYRLSLPLDYELPIIMKIVFSIPVSLIVFYNGGVELRKVKEFNTVYETVSHTTLNYLLFQKFIQNNILLVILILLLSGKLDNSSIEVSHSFLIFIICLSGIYCLLNIIDIFSYYLVPILNDNQYYEIESNQELVKLNEKNRSEKLQYKQISLKLYDKENLQQNINEYTYCLLFNFCQADIHIRKFGKRKRDKNGMVVKFYKHIDISYLQQVLKKEQIIPQIYQIEIESIFQEELSNRDICLLIKLMSEQKQNITVTCLHMPVPLLQAQNHYIKLKFDIILLYLSYQKIIQDEIGLNPKHVILDFFEESILLD